jgi:hypothetical protein
MKGKGIGRFIGYSMHKGSGQTGIPAEQFKRLQHIKKNK